MRYIILFFFTLIQFSLYAQMVISGKVVDENGQSVVGVTVAEVNTPNIGAITDLKGEYKLSLKKGDYTLRASSIGFNSETVSINVNSSMVVNFSLSSDAHKISEVVVSGNRLDNRINSPQIGAEKIVLAEMVKMPALFGEKDIVKTLTYLPGVKAQGDGQSGYMVRGGSVTQNLMLFDNSQLYNTGHALGIFSVINSDALSEATLYKGLIPAQFGGAASSIFDIKSKTGDVQGHKFGVDIGVLAAKARAEGAIFKDKASFFIAARRSYFDAFLKLTEEYNSVVMNFCDVNGSLYYQVNETNSLTLSGFYGGDNLALQSMFDMQWGNLNGSLNWYRRYNMNLTSNTTLYHSEYDAETSMSVAGLEIYLNGAIDINGLTHDFIYNRKGHTMHVGVQSSMVGIVSGDWTFNGYQESESRDGIENAAWINDEWKITSSLTVSMGLRLTNFLVMGGDPYYGLDSDGNIESTKYYDSGEVVKSYFVLEPRLSVNYKVTDNQSLKLGYARTSQNIYRIENNAMLIPFTRYTMASNNLKPQISDQVSVGYVTLVRDQKYEFSVEAYYKATQNTYDYKDGVSMTSQVEIEQLLSEGRGRAYGVEFTAKKNKGIFSGWVGYTLAWAETKIPTINNGEWYYAGHDIRHNVSVVAMLGLPKGWSASAAWIYCSGKPLTAPSAKYEVEGQTAYYYAERNGYRVPSYHRLDISFTHTKVARRYTREWSFGAYNAYHRYNPFMVSFEDDETSDSGSVAVQQSLYGILPSVNYGIKF